MIDELMIALLHVYELGGFVVMLLGAVAIIAVAVAAYKLWQYQRAGVGRHKPLDDAIHAWDAGDAERAHALLDQSDSYLAPLIRQAMTGTIEAARLDAEAEMHFGQLERGFRILDTASQLSPLLGLFGTVLGMITAFQALQDAGSQVDPSILAGGIWVALLTTAVGLTVAMPTSVLLSWFESRIDAERILADRAIKTILDPACPVIARASGAHA